MEDMSKVCDRFQQFCANSAKPLLYSGGVFTLISAVALGYVAYTSNVFYETVDKTEAAKLSLNFYLQLAASCYLLLLTLLVYTAAYYDQKHIIRVLAILTTINVALVLVSAQMTPTNQDLSDRFKGSLISAQKVYDFKDMPTNKSVSTLKVNETSAGASTEKENIKRDTESKKVPDPKESTKIWDFLQRQGCCGFDKKDDWVSAGKLTPKSCCDNPIEDKDTSMWKCDSVDSRHAQACSDVIRFTGTKLIAVFAFIGVNNLYLAIVTIIIAYRTLHYSEASQNAYN